MIYRLLLVDGQGKAIAPPLRIRMLREFPGPEGLSVHFRPVRNDLLFESAKLGGQLAYRVLRGEGIARSQLWVEYEVPGPQVNVMGRSSDLLFALALITAKWKLDHELAIAATGTLAPDGAVGSVEHTAEKVAAAIRELGEEEDAASAIVFFPLADSSAVEAWRAGASIPEHIELRAVAHIDDALAHLGYTLEKVYLRNPFRGLEHFDYSDHSIFFGRDSEVRDVVQQLLRREEAGAPGLLVEGASGSGKSSFLRAGVLPALVEPRFQSDSVQAALRLRRVSPAVGRVIWRPGLLAPEADERQLVSSIVERWTEFPHFSAGWCDSPVESLEELARRRREHWTTGMRFVWLIDQLEEILARGLSETLIDAFGRFLKALQDDGAWTLVSIRADATPLLKRHETLREVFGANEGQYYLATLSGTALDAVITRPARAADLTFEVNADGKSLDQRLREDVYREKDSLPVLQFTLNELYQKRAGNELTHTAYEALGGLSGSIATTAQAVLSFDGDASRRAAPRVFRSLVSVDDSGRATRRYAPLADMAADAEQQQLLRRLIEARLCVTDQREGQSVVAFAHDTLLHTLPALTEWLKQEAGLLQTRELALREAQSWQQHGRSDDWLAAADKLAAFQTLETAEIVLPESVRAFIDRSGQRLRRVRRIRRIAIGVIAALAAGVVVGAVAFGLQARKAEEAREMTARRGEFLEGLLKSADPRGGKRDITVAQLLDASAQEIDHLAVKEPRVAASMLGLVAETNEGLGRYPEGLAANTRALELLRTHGGSPIEVAEALSTRGALLESAGHYRESEAPLREAIALIEHRRGAEKQLAEALDDLGAAYQESSREKDAETMYQRALEVYRTRGTALAASAPATDPIANLGVLRYNEGRYAEAATYMRQAVEMRKKILPRDHPDLLDAEYNYAASLEKQGQVTAAEPVFRELLASYERVLGPKHIDTLMAAEGVAHNLLKQGRYAEAAALALPAAQGMSAVAGDDHQWTQATWGVYGVAACLGGQGDAGLAALRRVAGFRRSGADVNDWRTQITDVEIGTCLVALRRFAEAESLLLGAAATLEAGRGAAFENTQEAYRALRDLYAGTGNMAESARWQGKLVVANK
jgi:tetratricopeptide (TPR) repeat protein